MEQQSTSAFPFSVYAAVYNRHHSDQKVNRGGDSGDGYRTHLSLRYVVVAQVVDLRCL